MKASTLSIHRHEQFKSVYGDMIDEFIKSGKMVHCLPAGVPGSEVSRATREHIASERRKARKAAKTA